jgi:hypothetical protein
MENGGFAVANRSPKQAITLGPLFGLCRASWPQYGIAKCLRNQAFMTDHITDERLLEFIVGWIELTDGEEEHIRDCREGNDRFRMFLTSEDITKAS